MQLALFAAPDSAFGKTLPEHSTRTAGETLLAWLVRWQDAELLSPATVGETKAWRWASAACANGPCLTRSGTEWRSGAAACSLWSILETGPHVRRYFLSAKACAGIVRRAETRGKTLPPQLLAALTAAAANDPRQDAA
jgi:hypothetical protein